MSDILHTWHCYGAVTGTKYLGVVKAKTQEEAEALAINMSSTYVVLCHHCASEIEDPDIEDVTVEQDDTKQEGGSDE